jgi:hypothetical protein
VAEKAPGADDSKDGKEQGRRESNRDSGDRRSEFERFFAAQGANLRRPC